MRRLIPGILLLALVTGVAGCNDNNNNITTPTTPTTTTNQSTTTETFNGTAGTVTATLTAVGPDATLAIGLAIGSWTGSACVVTIANDAAIQGAAVPGTVTAAAALCARVYATGKVSAAQPVSFTVTVTHP
jgi:hypothetical protein